MKEKELNLVYFSPTKTTHKILDAIAKGLSVNNLNEINLTTHSPLGKIEIKENQLTIIGTPVYGGRIPEIAAKRLKSITANNSLAVIIVVYGNRDYGDALMELKDISEASGFNIIAAGAFIGEHSFSTNEKQIAFNRPDKNDIQIANDFGKKILKKLNEITPFEKKEILIPGNHPYKEIKAKPFIAPETDREKCILCGECIDVCPTNAITLGDKITTDNQKCIWCFACVKFCKQDARYMHNENITNIQNMLVEKCSDRKEPSLFI